MIDWLDLGANAIWISGVSLIVAVFSTLRADVLERQGRTREIFSAKAWGYALNGGLTLFSSGMAYLAAGWRMAAWAALAVWFGIEVLRTRPRA